MTIKESYRQFLNDNFKGLSIQASLFFNWDRGLRFDLQEGEVGSDNYFDEVFKRSLALFHASFDPNDIIFFVLMDFKHKRSKIRLGNFCFKQVHNLNWEEIAFLKMYRLYEPKDSSDIRNVAVIKSNIGKINYRNIFKAIGNTDFASRHPRLDRNGVLSSKEVFFLNIDRKLIFHMYDDRGVDIIAADVEQLGPIYNQYNNWLLECNKKKIDSLFNKNLS
ncbi:MAG: DUF3885 domain-containing protein [Candidatus Pedobacter colombiensis]|uniref:DUF3885 domain-containing protein n=1 Tax=Candidatus Pedobacter colombiensis TaxID=3121371 RepID=A0AAJ6B9Z0_9SPHI|nr:DUF3885 domain-containing protein [Pedobacter sp.]WEK20718.1 MAG: DUF3885 domain-containing protein [Pedobacter sp.]